jgi:hypothetical protein
MSDLGALHPYLVLVVVGFLPNEIWRLLGVVLGHGIDENSELIVWVRAVAIAVLAAVIAKIVLVSPGALADVPLVVRLGALGSGFVAFLAIRQSVFAGILVGEAVLMLGGVVFAR